MSVQRPNITRGDSVAEYGRSSSSSSKRRFVDPQSPRTSDAIVSVDERGPIGGNSILYLVLAAAGISMGISVFLYREMRRLKTDLDVTQKKLVNETKEANEETTQKLTQLAQNMQALHIYIKNNAEVMGRTPPPTPIELPKKEVKLPKPEGTKKVEVLENGPDRPLVGSERNSDLLCEDGVCALPKKDPITIPNVIDMIRPDVGVEAVFVIQSQGMPQSIQKTKLNSPIVEDVDDAEEEEEETSKIVELDDEEDES